MAWFKIRSRWAESSRIDVVESFLRKNRLYGDLVKFAKGLR